VNMMEVSEELKSTENRISFARQAFNDAVTNYNNRAESFPGNLLARIFNFQTATLWEVESAEERKAVKVSFT
jgi:LemA protein